MKSLLIFALTMFYLINAACANITNPLEFELYGDNGPVAPHYQGSRTIHGKINANNVAITYRSEDKNGKVERSLTLEGDKYQKCVELVRNTHIEVKKPGEPPLIGGKRFVLTLIDARGKKIEGEPSNRSEWEQFAEEIR